MSIMHSTNSTFLGTFLYASARKESKNSSLTILLFFLRIKRISLKDSTNFGSKIALSLNK
ncbi:hypothetical protein BpHYR1_052335 [Brachionus plicatilis]|uniref:Uncharacterized protein n=1 Tax=Brachionus plicatilis TaxID=10195 RepID=A0A3M7RU28_BRAPC|nr:hypothetical protein BpHYR1_052335 [Brachionus plicatilis]